MILLRKAAGFTPVIFDNLATVWEAAVKFGPFFRGGLVNRADVDAAFACYRPVAVLHFATLSFVRESMTDPGKYWRVNVMGALNLIEGALAAGCRNFVFSSTCTKYDDHDGVLLDRDSRHHPINAYGASKRDIKDMLGHVDEWRSQRRIDVMSMKPRKLSAVLS